MNSTTIEHGCFDLLQVCKMALCSVHPCMCVNPRLLSPCAHGSLALHCHGMQACLGAALKYALHLLSTCPMKVNMTCNEFHNTIGSSSFKGFVIRARTWYCWAPAEGLGAIKIVVQDISQLLKGSKRLTHLLEAELSIFPTLPAQRISPRAGKLATCIPAAPRSCLAKR